MANIKRDSATTKKPSAGQGATQAGTDTTQKQAQGGRATQAGEALQNQGSSKGTTSRRSPEEVARRAYELWQQRGGNHGSDQDDWLRAEKELHGGPKH